MSSIQTGIELNDQFSSVIYSIINAVNMAVSSMEDIQRALNDDIDTSGIQGIRDELNDAILSMDELNDVIQDNVNEQDRFNQEISEGTSQADNLVGTIKGAVAAYASLQTIGKVIELSDTMTQTTARLDQMNDGLQTTDELVNMVYAAAQDARGSFSDMADVVARFGNNAGDAFSSSEEVVAFADLVQKQMTIAGASTTEASNAMLQLSQALGSGVLRGDELNSIFEQAPNLIQSIADYLDVPIGKIREMASDGEISADIVKAAIFANADEINAKFNEMPMTWGQVWQSMKNTALIAFQPVLEKINELANSSSFQSFVSGATESMAIVADIVLGIFDLIGQIATFAGDNWSIIEPIIWGIVAALIVYNAVMGIGWLTTIKDTAAKAAHAVANGVQAAATFATTAAQQGLNAALAACPITWIIVGLIALIAIFYAVIAAVNKLTGSTYSATGIICGIFAVAFAFIGNGFITIWNIVAEIVTDLYNAFASFANFIGNLFNDPIAAVVKLVVDMGDAILGVVEGALEALSWVTFGLVDYTDDISRIRSNMNSWFEENYGDRYTEYVEKVDPNFLKKEKISYDDAWDAGYSFGEDIEDAVSNFSLSDLFNSDGIPNPDDYTSKFDDVCNGVNGIADDTDSISDTLDITEEDLKYLRDLAEQETVNRFTTAEITIEQTNNNNVSGSMDLDGVVSGLTDAVNEAVDIITEGVHD